MVSVLVLEYLKILEILKKFACIYIMVLYLIDKSSFLCVLISIIYSTFMSAYTICYLS